MHPPIPVGHATKIGIGVSVLGLLPPLVKEAIALGENVSVHWTGGDKTSLITGAAIAAITIGGRFVQAVVAILKGP